MRRFFAKYNVDTARGIRDTQRTDINDQNDNTYTEDVHNDHLFAALFFFD